MRLYRRACACPARCEFGRRDSKRLLRHKSLQMPLVYRNNVVEEFAAATSNPLLGHAILPRTLSRCSDGCDVHRADRNRHLQSIFCVVVEDQELGCRGIGKGFTPALTFTVSCFRRIDALDNAALNANGCIARFAFGSVPVPAAVLDRRNLPAG